MPSATRTPHRGWLLLELLGLFVMVPILLCFWAPLPVLPLLWAVAGVCGWGLLRDPDFDRADLWRKAALAGGLKGTLAAFALGTVVLLVLLHLLAPRDMFILVRQRPLLWLLILVLYPLLSVYPQELIYRTYFFHRYRPLFPDVRIAIVLNAVLFGHMHLIFQNWIAVGLTTVGGVMFAASYARSRSTLLVSLQHALFGWLIFTVGLGRFFYAGAVPTLPQSLRLFGG